MLHKAHCNVSLPTSMISQAFEVNTRMTTTPAHYPKSNAQTYSTA